MVLAFQQNPCFRYINLANSNFVERQQLLLPVLTTPALRLYSLNLAFCKLSNHSFAELVRALSGMAIPLSELCLCGNSLTTEDAELLSGWIATNRRLKLLDLGMNGKIGPKGLVHLTRGLELAGHPLQTLGISGIGLSNCSAKELEALVTHKDFKVEFLDVSWNQLVPDDSCAAMVAVIARLKTVRELHAMAIKLGLAGTKAFFENVEGNETFEILHLSSNYIDAAAGDLMRRVLPTLPQLRWVDFTSNPGFNSWLSFLPSTFAALKHLNIVSLCNCDLQSAGPQAVASLISHDTQLLELHLSFNNFTDAVAVAIGQALKENRKLINLRLDENDIGPMGSEALLESLQQNATLLFLDLSDNDFDPAIFDQLSFPNCPKRIIQF